MARRFLGAMLSGIVAASLAAEEPAALAREESLSAQLAEQASAANDVGWLLAKNPGGGAKSLVAFASPALSRDGDYVALPGATPVRLAVVSGKDAAKVSERDVDLVINLDAVAQAGLRPVLYADKSLSKNRPTARSIKVGWVDLSRTLADHPKQIAVDELLEKAISSVNQVLAGLREKVESLSRESDELQARLSRPDLPDTDRSALEARAQEVRTLIESRTEEEKVLRVNGDERISVRRLRSRELIIEEIAESIVSIARKRGVLLVFDTSSVDGDGQPMVIGVSGHDLNDEVRKARKEPAL